jgi:hypothetical protein
MIGIRKEDWEEITKKQKKREALQSSEKEGN